jgi:hypothetical protein
MHLLFNVNLLIYTLNKYLKKELYKYIDQKLEN